MVDATATLTGSGIAGKAAGLKLKAGAKNTIVMKLSKAASGKATFKIVLKTNGRPTTETRNVVVNARGASPARKERAAAVGPSGLRCALPCEGAGSLSEQVARMQPRCT